MLSQALQDFVSITRGKLPVDFLECEIHDIVMVQLFVFQFLAQFEPKFVQKIDLCRSEVGGVRSEKKEVRFAASAIYLKHDARTRLREPLPGKPDHARLFMDWHFRGLS